MSLRHVCGPWTMLCVVLMAVAMEAPNAARGDAATATECVYSTVDALGVDALDRWRPIGRMRLRLTDWVADKSPFAVEGRVAISKTEQGIHGMERAGIGMPLPETIRLHLWCDVPYLWVVIGDRAGHRMSSIVPMPGVPERAWGRATLAVADMVPMGVGASRAQDLDSIAILTQESAGEYDDEDTFRVCVSRVEAGYAAGSAPPRADLSDADVRRASERLVAKVAEIDALLAKAHSAGMEARYETSSRTVVARYAGEIVSMRADLGPDQTQRTLAWLDACADATERRLRELLADPRREVRVPHVKLANLRAHDGAFFAGSRPVVLAGVCGWFSPAYFAELSATGYSVVSTEIGPSSTLPAEGVRKPEAASGIIETMDVARQHNMVCDLLVSPHYFPGWARSKWPSTDVTGWRQKVNGFMPWTITDEHVRGVLADHLATLIPTVRKHPALISYDLINEAWYRPIPDFPAAGFASFRRADKGEDYWQSVAGYGTQTVTDFIRWFDSELRKHDTVHPVHIKANDAVDVLNCDREAIGEVLSANGMDAMPSYPDMTGRLAADFSWPLLRHDFHRSLQPDKPIMDGEYHISGGLYATPPAYFRAALWDLALHGRAMSACWVYGHGDDVSVYWHPACVEALGHAALDFVRLGPEIHAFQRQRGKLAMYYGGHAAKEAYLACLFQDVDVAVTTAKRIRSGALAGFGVLVLADGARLPADVAAAVEAWRKSGGVVVRCARGLEAQELWPSVTAALRRAGVGSAVRAGQWGVECRSVMLGSRRLLYVLNHRKSPVTVALRTNWDLAHARDLGTTEAVDARRIVLGPLELRLIEAL